MYNAIVRVPQGNLKNDPSLVSDGFSVLVHEQAIVC